jgi:hypothetical protein
LALVALVALVVLLAVVLLAQIVFLAVLPPQVVDTEAVALFRAVEMVALLGAVVAEQRGLGLERLGKVITVELPLPLHLLPLAVAVVLVLLEHLRFRETLVEMAEQVLLQVFQALQFNMQVVEGEA